MDEMKEELDLATMEPSEISNEDEKSLIAEFVRLNKEKDTMALQLKALTKKTEDIESQLMKLLEDDDKKASAKYEGLGHVVLVEGAAHASIEKGRQEDVIGYLKEQGREDMIKTTVASATLSVFVRDLLKMNQELPPGVTFYKPKWLNFYPIK